MVRFISFEGIEGVGKTTNIQFVSEQLKRAGKRVLCTREPGGTILAEEIRTLLLASRTEKVLPKTELLLLMAGRLQHVAHVIQPALERGEWVLCDRFIDASFAYQGGGGALIEDIRALHEWAMPGLKPDRTILFDAPACVSSVRLLEKKRDRIESEAEVFFEKVRQSYLSLAKAEPERFCVIDATPLLAKVQEYLQSEVLKWL